MSAANDEFAQIKQWYLDAKQGVIPKSVLFSGSEEYPIVSYLRLLKKTVPFPEMNISEFTDPFSYEAVRNAFDTLPMLSDYRLVLLHKTGYFKWNKDERFYDLFSNIPDHVRLIVFETDLNKISANYKRFEKSTRPVVLEKVSQKYLAQWVREEFGKSASAYRDGSPAQMTEAAVLKLSEIGAERGMFCIKNAVDYFAAVGGEIDASDVDEYFKTENKYSVWALYDHVTDARFVDVVSALLEEEDPFELFGRINSLIRNALRHQKGMYRGTPYMTKAVSRISSAFAEGELDELIRFLSRIDVEMKSTPARKEHLLLSAAMKIANTKRRHG